MAIHSINAVYAANSPTLLGEVSSIALWVDGGSGAANVKFTTTNNTFASWCVVHGTGVGGAGFNTAGIAIGVTHATLAPAISLPPNNINQSARQTWYQMIIPPGSKIDLNDWYFKVNAANEGIMIYYGI